MIILRKHLTGSYGVEDQNGKRLGNITRKLLSLKYIFKNPQGESLAYTDIYTGSCQSQDKTFFENTEYVLISEPGKDRLAAGFPAYNENVDASKLNTFYMKPPLTDRMTLQIRNMDERFYLRTNIRSGYTIITGIDGNILGNISRLKKGTFSVELSGFDAPVLLCGIFLFTKYLLNENRSIDIV